MVLIVFATLLLLAALLSSLAQRSVLSTAVMFLAAGILCGPAGFGFLGLRAADDMVLAFAELALFAVLFVDGLDVTWQRLRGAWRLPLRALALGLPLTLLVIAWIGHLVAGLSWLEALLVAAALSPTDPVFAAALIGEKAVPERIRHLLNLESGLNDGLALPVVIAMLALAGGTQQSPLVAAGEAAAGIGIGVAVPLVAVLVGRSSRIFGVSDEYGPIGAFAVGTLVLGLCRHAGANEFLAAFAAGMTLSMAVPRARAAFHPFGHPLAEILKLATLLLFGALLTFDLLHSLGWTDYVFAALVLVVARPVALAIALAGTDLSRRERLVVGWFGPKGFASVFFAFLILSSGMTSAPHLFQLLALTIVVSIVAHSSTDVLVSRRFRPASL